MMMESLQLKDLPLFNGDLLSVDLMCPLADFDGLSSFTDDTASDGSLLGLPQDGSTWSQLTLVDSSKTTDDSFVTQLPYSSSITVSNEDLLGSDWLDTRVDLVEYLSSSDATEVQPTLDQVSEEIMASTVTQLLESVGQPVLQDTSIYASPVQSITSPVPAEVPQQAVDMMEVLAKLTEAMDDTYEFEQSGVKIPCEPILSPMSAEEVESILSSSPVSPGNSSIADDSGFIDEYTRTETLDLSSFEELSSYHQQSEPGPQRGGGRSRKTKAPYPKSDSKPLEKKLRKKQQNKDAALRYRMKKKAEGDVFQNECDQLETRNKELRDKVDSMTREINYLKSLMAEVYKAKALINASKK